MSRPGDRAARAARGDASCRIPWAALVVVLPGLLVACSTATRYAVLSFLFDGVPDPSQRPPSEFVGPPLPPARHDLLHLAGGQQYRQHAPYAERKCAACHVERKGGGGPLAGLQLQDLGQLKMPKEQLCVTCHAVPDRRHHHAPALLGDCLRCHNPHASPHPGLLHSPTPNGLCRVCHVADPLPSAAAHAAWGDRNCADCHEPHASDLRYFLRPDWERRLLVEPPAALPFGPPPPPPRVQGAPPAAGTGETLPARAGQP